MSENDGIEKNSFEHETKSSHYPSLTEQQIKDEIDDLHKVYPIAVSYTHLTLPTT